MNKMTLSPLNTTCRDGNDDDDGKCHEILVVRYSRCDHEQRHWRHNNKNDMGMTRPNNSRDKEKLCVRFADSGSLVTVISNEFKTTNDTGDSDAWYTDKEYYYMRRREALLMKDISTSFMNEQFRVDGVESISYRKARRVRQIKSVLSVLMEQEKYWPVIEDLEAKLQHGYALDGCVHNATTADVTKSLQQVLHNKSIKIARVYSRHARQSRRVAFEMAYRLAKQVEDELAEVNRNNNGDDHANSHDEGHGDIEDDEGNSIDEIGPSILQSFNDSSSTVELSENYQKTPCLVPQVE